MANITRIKAGGGSKKAETKKTPKNATLDKKALKTAVKAEKVAKKAEKTAKKPQNKFVRVLTAPFRYIRDSWLELRQVRWPSRGATWKMVLAVFVYAALIMGIIMLLDVFFTWLFNLVLGQ